MLIGCILVLLNAINIISAISTCYPVNGQRYCLYSHDSKLSWADARQFCASRNSTLPIITDEHIDRAFQQFISDNNIVSGPDAGQTGNYVWLDLHARRVDSSDQWHWINGQPSALKTSIIASRNSGLWSASIGRDYNRKSQLYENAWSDALVYVCQYHAVTPIEADCVSEWTDHGPRQITADSVQHYRTSTREQCQKACEFDPRCVAVDVDYRYNADHCWININRHHTHTPFYFAIIKHHDLVSRCNITTETNCDGGIVYNSRCYKVHRERVNWFTAVNRCLTNNGSLASFDDNILKYFATTLLTEGPIWIGLIRSPWTWPDAGGQDVSFNKFDTTSSDPPGSPPNVTNSVYDCVVATTGFWRLSRCSDIQRVVCQSDGPRTTPATPVTTSPVTTSINRPTTGELASQSTAHTTEFYFSVTHTETTADEPDVKLILIAGIVVVVVVVALVVVIIIIVVAAKRRRRRRSEQQKRQKTEDSKDAKISPESGQYESINLSVPSVVYAKVNPAEKPEPEYDEVP